jgi:16S rRNA (adenine1518-N6/adenine1519-N6)-dimethyltransferase
MYRGIKIKKKLGQHFLINEKIKQKIIEYADISKKDVILEIGPGIGTLTTALCKKARKVIAIEKDRELVDFLINSFSNEKKVEIIEGDVLKIKLPKADKIVSTPPYNISSELIFLSLDHGFKTIVLVLQKEFARRLISKPGSKNFGRLTVMVRYKGEAELLECVSKESFYPVPKVDSAIVRIIPRKDIPKLVYDDLFNDFVRKLFSQRRKKVRKVIISFLEKRIEGYSKKITFPNKLEEKRIYELSNNEIMSLFLNITDKKDLRKY